MASPLNSAKCSTNDFVLFHQQEMQLNLVIYKARGYGAGVSNGVRGVYGGGNHWTHGLEPVWEVQ